jgi:hypothetical protein
MKRLILLLFLAAIATANGFTGDNSLLARVTVYWARGGGGEDRYTRQHKSATGLRLQQGHCAVRNRKAARRLGRTIPERNAIVIDKFFETKHQALAWANSNPPFVSVKVIPPGAPAVAKPNITNSQPIALIPAATTTTTTNAAPASSAGAVAATTNASAAGPTGASVRNPLGRLGR